MKRECGNIERKKKAGDECSKCGAEYEPAEFKPGKNQIKIADDVIVGYNSGGGMVVRVKSKPRVYPTTWYGVLRHVRDCRVRGAALSTVAELVNIEEKQESLMRELAAQIIEKMGPRKS